MASEAAAPWANWNGVEMPLDEVRVSVLDRAFLFGDAVYEALRVYEGRAWLCTEHMARLQRSLDALRIRCDVDRLTGRMLETLANSGVRQGLVYIQVTRGAAPRTHAFPKGDVAPNELIWVAGFDGDPYAAHREAGAKVITHADIRWGRRDIKSVNLLGNCLAAQAAVEAEAVEAILVGDDGRITEGSHTNLFGVKDGSVLTSPTGHHILPGITRRLVLQLAERANVPVVEKAITTDNLNTIDELFLTGTTTEVLAVTRVDDHPVGEGTPGPITQLLYETYQETVAEWLASE